MKKYLLAFLTLILFSLPVFAESTTEFCASEANAMGIDDVAELNEYINDCVAKMSENDDAESDVVEAGNNTSESSDTNPSLTAVD